MLPYPRGKISVSQEAFLLIFRGLMVTNCKHSLSSVNSASPNLASHLIYFAAETSFQLETNKEAVGCLRPVAPGSPPLMPWCTVPLQPGSNSITGRSPRGQQCTSPFTLRNNFLFSGLGRKEYSLSLVGRHQILHVNPAGSYSSWQIGLSTLPGLLGLFPHCWVSNWNQPVSFC